MSLNYKIHTFKAYLNPKTKNVYIAVYQTLGLAAAFFFLLDFLFYFFSLGNPANNTLYVAKLTKLTLLLYLCRQPWLSPRLDLLDSCLSQDPEESKDHYRGGYYSDSLLALGSAMYGICMLTLIQAGTI